MIGSHLAWYCSYIRYMFYSICCVQSMKLGALRSDALCAEMGQVYHPLMSTAMGVLLAVNMKTVVAG